MGEGGAANADELTSATPIGYSANHDSTPALIQYMESGVDNIISLGLPTFRDSFSKMSKGVSSVAAVLQMMAGVACENVIFYVLAIGIIGVTLFSSFKTVKQRTSGSKSDAVIKATANVFEENYKTLMAKHKDNPELVRRLDAMKGRLTEAKAAHNRKHAENKRKIWIITAVCSVLFIAGVTPLAINNYKENKAEAEYAQQPTWIKVRDAYISSEYNNEYGDNSARLYVITEMLNADQSAAAEEFFFGYCMGYVGDFDCAKLIIERYRSRKEVAALESFQQRLELRYDSDTQKAKQIK